MPVKQGREGVRQEMHKFKHGELHSGSKTGPVVKNRAQAIAIALHEAGMSRQRAEGGHVNPTTGYRGGFQPMEKGGFIATDVPGRTDKHYVTVKEGSYVLPADHVSALGQNNSIAGAKVVRDMFGHGTRYGPRLKIPAFARGGGIRESDGVPVVVAGGEIVLPPEIVRRIGNGNLQKGHESLDRWVLATRKKHIKKLKSLKPPKGADEK